MQNNVETDQIKTQRRGLIIINAIMVAFIMLCVFGITELIRESGSIHRSQDDISELYNKHSVHIEACFTLYRSSDYLTDQVRLYAESENLENIQNYLRMYYSIKESEQANKVSDDVFGIKQLIAAAFEKSEELSHIEFFAMRLLLSDDQSTLNNYEPIKTAKLESMKNFDFNIPHEEKKEIAKDLLTNQEYENMRSFILNSCNEAIDKINQGEQAELQKLINKQTVKIKSQSTFVAIFISLEIILALLVIFHSVNQFKRERKVEEIKEETKELHDQLTTYENIAKTDSLTGLHTANYYYEIIEDIRKQPGDPFCLIMCDINDLKKTNDSFGHAVGNRYIVNFSNVVKRVFDKDVVCRFGGDEFIIILRGKNFLNREELIKKFKDEADKAEKIDGIDKGYVSFSFGEATYKPDGDIRIDEVLEIADMRMYNDKKRYKTSGS